MTDPLHEALAASRGTPVAAAAAAAARRAADAAARQGLADVAYARVDSPLGPLVAAATGRGLVLLAYEQERLEALLERLARRLSPRVLEAPAQLDALRRQLDEYFTGRRRRFDVPVDWSLTAGFTRKVLQRTAGIPFGAVRTYREVAAAAGSPRGSRAAGQALGANPVAIVVPCHRVLRTGGGLGGYTSGVDKKAYLLRLEGVLT